MVFQYKDYVVENSDSEDEWYNKSRQIDYLKAKFTEWTSENDKIDDFVREIQLKFIKFNDIIFEWISYDQFNEIKEVDNVLYLAKWKSGPLYYQTKWIREPNKKVILKYLYKSENMIDEFLYKVMKFYKL